MMILVARLPSQIVAKPSLTQPFPISLLGEVLVWVGGPEVKERREEEERGRTYLWRVIPKESGGVGTAREEMWV